MRAWLAAASLVSVFAACAPLAPVPATKPPTVPSGFPADDYRLAATRGEPVFRLDTERSLVVVRVFRGGALAKFGHDHVVAIRDVHGYARLPDAGGAGRADLYAPLASVSVDEPALRAQAGFDTQPSQQDIDGTRDNMLEKVLEAERYPFVSIHLNQVTGELPAISVSAAVSLHGKTHTVPLTIELETPSTEAIFARGRFSVKQTDFGITPYSLLGGALRVADQVDIEFQLSATRMVR